MNLNQPLAATLPSMLSAWQKGLDTGWSIQCEKPPFTNNCENRLRWLHRRRRATMSHTIVGLQLHLAFTAVEWILCRVTVLWAVIHDSHLMVCRLQRWRMMVSWPRYGHSSPTSWSTNHIHFTLKYLFSSEEILFSIHFEDLWTYVLNFEWWKSHIGTITKPYNQWVSSVIFSLSTEDTTYIFIC